MDLLCLMFGAPNRGVLAFADGSPWPDRKIAEAVGGDVAGNLVLLEELLSNGVAHRNGRGAVFSRRMTLDQKEREDARFRKRKERGVTVDVTQFVTPNVTPLSGTANGTESLHLEAKDLKPPLNSDELIESVIRLHPANWHWKNSKAEWEIPQAQLNAVIEAIHRHKLDVVLTGTKVYAEFVEANPGCIVYGAMRFYGPEAHYLKTRSDWEKSNGSKKQQGDEALRRAAERVAAANG